MVRYRERFRSIKPGFSLRLRPGGSTPSGRVSKPSENLEFQQNSPFLPMDSNRQKNPVFSLLPLFSGKCEDGCLCNVINWVLRMRHFFGEQETLKAKWRLSVEFVLFITKIKSVFPGQVYN